MTLAQPEKRQLAWITAGAVAVFLFMRFLPTGTNLSHMDFRVTGANSIETCDPLNPQFIPVVAVRSPVSMVARFPAALAAGVPAAGVLTLKTFSGKPIAPEDLVVVHTKLLHLLVVDPTLADYQHVHPEPAAMKGEWTFSFTPRLSGVYRLFADFTPAATGRGLYANADVAVGNPAGAKAGGADASRPGRGAMASPNWVLERDGGRFELTPSARPVHARQPTDLKFSIRRTDGGTVPMELVMGAFAHLVAFDTARSGFAHLHPMEANLLQPPDATRPTLNFKITIPRAGRYVIWAQVNLGGRETFVPFWFDVVE